MPPAPPSIEINGIALREIRIRSGLEQRDVADAADIGRPYVTQIETGARTRVSPKVFTALLRALAISDRRALLANPFGASQ